MNDKESIIIKYFKDNPTMYIKDISRSLNIPRSTVQRYLKKNGKLNIPGTSLTIEEQLSINKGNGNVKGGINSFKNNDSIKNSKGLFIGNKRTDKDYDKELKKESDIIKICNFYMSNPTYTLDEVVSIFSDTDIYTRDYVYDCLTDKRIPILLGEDVSNRINRLLDSNRYSFIKKSNNIDIDKDSLSDMERDIIKLREDGLSLDDISKKYGVSRSTILKYEDDIINRGSDKRVK